MSISEFKLNGRRNWKAEVFNYDHYLPDNSMKCSVCLTKKQAEILMAIIEPLAWMTRWYSPTDATIDSDVIEDFRDSIKRELMMCCCDENTPIQYRYTTDGTLQESSDGGATWQDAPNKDPRNYSPQFPPIAGTDGLDKKCVAATGAALLVKEQVGSQITGDMTRYTLSQLITDWVKNYIETSNPFIALLTVIANQIFALVLSALSSALTDSTYNQFKCILYCNMSSDASFTNDQWVSVRSDCTSKITGIAGIFFEHLVYLLGSGGLTNLVRAGGASSGDCSGCSCGTCAQVWNAGYNFEGSPYFADTLVERTDTYITVHSFDRGDGLQVCAVTGLSSDDGCCVGWEFTTYTPSSIAKSATGLGVIPTYENLVLNPLMTSPVECTSIYILANGSDGTTPFTVKFSFQALVDGACP